MEIQGGRLAFQRRAEIHHALVAAHDGAGDRQHVAAVLLAEYARIAPVQALRDTLVLPAPDLRQVARHPLVNRPERIDDVHHDASGIGQQAFLV